MKIGDIIRDNDPRVGKRFLQIVAMEPPFHVRAKRVVNGNIRNYPKNGYRIMTVRIYPPGTERKGGFTIVREAT